MPFGKFVRKFGQISRFKRAETVLDAGDYDAAVEAFAAVIAAGDAGAADWYNLGLAHKFRRDWAASAMANRRSAELDPKNEPAFWNCGVAATAIRDWRTARWAWRGIGMEAEDGDEPPDIPLGITPVRLNPDDTGEVTWGRRIDPCRVSLESVPLPESGHRWRDVVLHDVVPHGERAWQGQTWFVFDELIRLDPSDHPTFEAELTVPTEADLLDIDDRFRAADLGVEDWSTIRALCKQCSESSAHAHESALDPKPIWLAARRFGLAGPRSEVERVLAEWASEGPGRAFGPVVEAAD